QRQKTPPECRKFLLPMQAGPEVRDGFKEREVARLERTRGVWTSDVIHNSHYAAPRFRDTEPGRSQKLFSKNCFVLAKTHSLPSRSGIMRAISSAPIIVEKIAKNARSLSTVLRPGMKRTRCALYSTIEAPNRFFRSLSARASSGASAAKGQPVFGWSQWSWLRYSVTIAFHAVLGGDCSATLMRRARMSRNASVTDSASRSSLLEKCL